MSYTTTFTSLKLALLNNNSQAFAIGDSACANATDVTELVADFFRHVLKGVKNSVQELLLAGHSINWDNADIHLVLSVPATGSEESRGKYWKVLEDSVVKAGFSAPNHQIVGDMMEPKAAARYALQHMAKGETQGYKASGQNFLHQCMPRHIALLTVSRAATRVSSSMSAEAQPTSAPFTSTIYQAPR